MTAPVAEWAVNGADQPCPRCAQPIPFGDPVAVLDTDPRTVICEDCATCTCTRHNGQRMAIVPWSAPNRPGCPVHPHEICQAVHRLLRSSSTGLPIDTPCNTRLEDGTCPNAERHA